MQAHRLRPRTVAATALLLSNRAARLCHADIRDPDSRLHENTWPWLLWLESELPGADRATRRAHTTTFRRLRPRLRDRPARPNVTADVFPNRDPAWSQVHCYRSQRAFVAHRAPPAAQLR